MSRRQVGAVDGAGEGHEPATTPQADGGPKPEIVTTDTASYSDMVFGLFAICGYQFAPRLADLADSRIWRMPQAPVPAPLRE